MASQPHIRFNTEVIGATWNDETATWTVLVRAADGSSETLDARAVISAVGQLNRPHIPEIAGQENFTGPSFHSARWDHNIDLTGKRVAMIGAGASGFQIAPTIAERRRPPHDLPAHRTVDVPEPQLPRGRRRRASDGR